MQNLEFLDIFFLGNRVLDYFISLGLFFLFLIIFKIFKTIILSKLQGLLKKIKTDIGEVFIGILQKIKPSFYLYLAFYLALKFLNINSFAVQVLDGILIAWVVYQVIISVQILIDFVLEKRILREADVGDQSAYLSISKIVKVLLWVFGILLVISNLGINITSIVAGLGIGGLAIAIALQNILSDLFSSFAIYFDKPFVVGDFIVVGENRGVVERIGIKTTRIRAIQGEELVVSNRELTSANIQNFKKMKERRIVFNFGVEYSTSLEKLKKIPDIVGKIIKKEEMTRFDRAHFSKFDDYSLLFEVVYFVLSSEYVQFMNAHQSILFQIKEAFEKEEISMAFPTRTVFLEKNNSRDNNN